MTLQGTLITLLYVLQPFLWLILFGVVLLVIVQLVARLNGYRTRGYRSLGAALVALLIGLSGLWWVPAFTHSRLAYVAAAFDWVALIGIVVGLIIVTWLVLHPLSYLVQGRRTA